MTRPRALHLRRALPTLDSVEAQPDGQVRLTLEDGAVLIGPAPEDASLTPSGWTPRILHVHGGPLEGAYIIPDALTPAALDALAFPFTVQGFQAQPGRVTLTRDRDGGDFHEVHEVTISTPAAFTVSSPNGQAVNSTGPHRLTFEDQPRPAFLIPADLWPALHPLLTGEEETSGPVARLEAVEVREGCARLYLGTGQAVTVSPTGTPCAVLLPPGRTGVAVFRADWKAPASLSVTVPRLEDAATLTRFFDEGGHA